LQIDLKRTLFHEQCAKRFACFAQTMGSRSFV
jgi:hypothetical protein